MAARRAGAVPRRAADEAGAASMVDTRSHYGRGGAGREDEDAGAGGWLWIGGGQSWPPAKARRGQVRGRRGSPRHWRGGGLEYDVEESMAEARSGASTATVESISPEARWRRRVPRSPAGLAGREDARLQRRLSV
ncbi:proline-rich receptor-like protein kinase PERK9 [Iris pallida]|uniref:Proline-rich receptor-like protein kinase PERK9 n=1 Tax=Iris pallida TaxID=29817 RepID=A0AAX6FZQ5_IRIPA|nr:proline-rich receptor-like protein kinase PERK9 [Iris pallida]